MLLFQTALFFLISLWILRDLSYQMFLKMGVATRGYSYKWKPRDRLNAVSLVMARTEAQINVEECFGRVASGWETVSDL